MSSPQQSATERNRTDGPLRKLAEMARVCTGCGMCLAACPSYALSGDERQSPRGRIRLMAAVAETPQAPSWTRLRLAMESCLGCLTCELACPHEVPFGRMRDLVSAQLSSHSPGSLSQRFFGSLLAYSLREPRRLALSVRASLLLKPFAPLLEKAGLKKTATLGRHAPYFLPPRNTFPAQIPEKTPQETPQTVILFRDCRMRVLRPTVEAAAVALLTEHGYAVDLMPQGGCCGAMDRQMGRHEAQLASARHHVDRLWQRSQNGSVTAILALSAFCQRQLQEYAALLADDPALARRASEVAAQVEDVTAFLSRLTLSAPRRWSDLTIAWHPACATATAPQSRTKNQKTPVVRLLETVGFSVLPPEASPMCCGGYGTFPVFQAEAAQRLGTKTSERLETHHPDVIATNDMGCLGHLSRTSQRPVVHVLELVAWALGGSCPPDMEHLAHRATAVRSLISPEK